MADFDIVRVELVGSFHRQSASRHNTFCVQLFFLFAKNQYQLVALYCLFVGWFSDMFRSDLIAHLQGTGIDSL